MTTDRRPLSPHLQVYRPQLTSVLSILHRATGIGLAAGTLLLTYWLAALAAGPQSYATAERVLGSKLGLLLLFLWSWALFYHLCNGIRHLCWDAGYGFDIPSVNKSGKAVAIASTVLTFLFWLIIG